jgi:hypothetical protein
VELAAGNGDRIQLFGPGHRSFEFYRGHGASTVPLLEVDDLDQARPNWPAAVRAILGALAGADAAALRGDILVARWRAALNAALYTKFQSDGFQPPPGGQSAVVAQTRATGLSRQATRACPMR